MGKAIEADAVGCPSDPKNETEQKRFDMERSNAIRGLLVERANAQVGWHGQNRKSLEPQDIAPTWINWDVRSYQLSYLDDRFFVKSEEEFLDFPKIKI